MLDAFLDQMNVTVVPFGMEEASRAASSTIGKWDFSENAHDYAVGATSITLDATLVTNNINGLKMLQHPMKSFQRVNITFILRPLHIFGVHRGH